MVKLLFNDIGVAMLISYAITAVLGSIYPSWFKYVEMLVQIWIMSGVIWGLHCVKRRRFKIKVQENSFLIKKKEIFYDNIKKIEGHYNEILNVIVHNNSFDIALERSDLVKLSRSILKAWTIKGSYFTILLEKEDEQLFVKYAPIAKYQFSIPKWLWIGVFPIICWLLGGIGILLIALVALIYFFLNKYKQVVEVSIDHLGIHYKDDIAEQFIAFSEIIQVKKKFNKIVVIKKDGTELAIPLKCILIQEFIVAYSNLQYH